jgi:hypothetical protein
MAETTTVPFYIAKSSWNPNDWDVDKLFHANNGKQFEFFHQDNIIKTDLIRYSSYTIVEKTVGLEKYNFTLELETMPIVYEGRDVLCHQSYYFKLTEDSHKKINDIISKLLDSYNKIYLEKSLKALGIIGETNDTIL